MKFFMALIFGASFISFASVASAQDIKKINQVLSEVITEVLVQDDFITELEVVFDEQATDVAKPKAILKVKASTQKAVWSKVLTTLVLGLDIDTKRVNSDVNIYGNISGELKTDVFAMAKYYITDETCSDESKTSSEFQISEQICLNFVSQIQNAKKFSEQKQAVISTLELLKVNIVSFITTKKADLLLDLGNTELEEEILRAEQGLNELNKITYMESGDRVTFYYSLNDVVAEFSGQQTKADLVLVFGKDDVALGVVFDLTVDQAFFNDISMTLEQILVMIESGTPEVKSMINGYALSYIELLKDVVAEKN